MRFLDFVVLVLLVIMLVFGSYFLWLNLPAQSTEFEKYVANSSFDLPDESLQFHPNMRYSDRKISYSISSECDVKKREDFVNAVDFLESETILEFYETNDAEIAVTCSDIEPEPDEEGHFVAGEGGPSKIINASRFAVILEGRIALYRPETCDTPQIAVHELLHALGFNHNNNKNSIMYPVTSCRQTLDRQIVEDIRALYSVPSAGDLVLEEVEANKTGRFMDFKIVIANYGLKEISNSDLKVFVEGDVVQEHELGSLDIGSKKSLNAVNVRVPRDTRAVRFVIETDELEISRENNEAIVSLSV